MYLNAHRQNADEPNKIILITGMTASLQERKIDHLTWKRRCILIFNCSFHVEMMIFKIPFLMKCWIFSVKWHFIELKQLNKWFLSEKMFLGWGCSSGNSGID